MAVQLMLVYRFLRKISDWTMAGFYSEVYVAGPENVPRDGPIILAATHHNEIIDIAALSVTIPHRRRICYWAKSTLFKNPFSGALLRSSGSIPVHRNPNSIGSHSGSGPLSSASSTTSQADLFKYTSAALARGEVVGVFPEGTSYTEPAIAQVKEGAAWAAIEYVKAVAARATGEAGTDLTIVPAAIVYTDKSRYQSRVLVRGLPARYAKPIRVDDFLAGLDLEDDDSVRAAVKEITGEIYKRLKEMTTNAPDWDTYNSARIATEMELGEDLSLGKHVVVSQTLIELLSGEDQEIRSIKQSLVKYLGLLHYTGISHAALDYLYPLPIAITFPSTPTVPIAILTVLDQLCKTFLHPNAIAFLPMFVVHLPVYIVGCLAARVLTKHGEEEAKAQFKAIFGGLGMSFSYGMVIRMVFKAFMHVAEKTGPVQKSIGTVAVTVGIVRILWKWHNYLVRGNLERWRRLSASVKIMVGLVSHASNDLPEERLVAYSRPPAPAENPFVKPERVATKFINPPPVCATKLIRPLLAARLDAVDAVRKLKVARKDRMGGGKDERRELPNEGGD